MAAMNHNEQELREVGVMSGMSTASAGAVLAEQRKIAGLSVGDVAAKLKLSPRQIEALESNRFDLLPGNTFVRGFVRNYARLLGADPAPLLAYLAEHLPKETPQSALPRLVDQNLPALRPDRKGAGAMVFTILLFALIGGGVFYLYQRGWMEPKLILTEVAGHGTSPEPTKVSAETATSDVTKVAAEVKPAVSPVPAEQSIEPGKVQDTPVSPAILNETAHPVPPAQQATAPVAPEPVLQAVTDSHLQQAQAKSVPATTEVKPEQKSTVVALPSVPLTPPVSEGDIHLIAHEDSWVSVVDASGKHLINEVVKSGTTRVVGGVAPYKVRIGNAGKTELVYKGKATDLSAHTKINVATLELP